jgi:hypothetical protein
VKVQASLRSETVSQLKASFRSGDHEAAGRPVKCCNFQEVDLMRRRWIDVGVSGCYGKAALREHRPFGHCRCKCQPRIIIGLRRRTQILLLRSPPFRQLIGRILPVLNVEGSPVVEGVGGISGAKCGTAGTR